MMPLAVLGLCADAVLYAVMFGWPRGVLAAIGWLLLVIIPVARARWIDRHEADIPPRRRYRGRTV